MKCQITSIIFVILLYVNDMIMYMYGVDYVYVWNGVKYVDL